MKRREFLGTLGTGVVAAVRPFAALSAGSSPRFIERWSWAMGQAVHLQLYAPSDDHGYEAAAAALAELRRVEDRLSLFDAASDLSELNRRAGRQGGRFGPDLAAVLALGLRIERETHGAFNPAIEPLMRAWGFRQPRISEPSAREIRAARASVLAARVVLEGERISLPSSETRLDLGGIGVGYGLDRAAAVLRRMGIGSALLDVSGDCIAVGVPPGSEGWLVEIAPPVKGGRPVGFTHLRDAALATSANTASVVRYGRAARGHVMNPESGWPADALVQVSVVARSGVESDALSTAMLVSGRPDRGVVRYYKA
ncbi:MAG: FAD:protein FMN transferase [Gemmatimonadales bacterium]